MDLETFVKYGLSDLQPIEIRHQSEGNILCKLFYFMRIIKDQIPEQYREVYPNLEPPYLELTTSLDKNWAQVSIQN